MRWFEHVSTLLYTALAALILLSSSFTDCAQVTEVTQLEPVGLCANVTLRCTAEPAETVVWWTKDGANISAATTVVTEVRDEDVLLQLVIDCTHTSDQGTYSCHALDGDSLSTNLTVQAAPVFIMSEGSHVGLGGNAEVLCAFRGVPAPNITWLLLPGGVAIDSDTPRYSMTTSELVGSLVESHLIKSNITRRDNSTLECRAQNIAGNASATVSILVIEPPRITALSATAVGKSRIFVNWTVNDGNAQIELYRLQYRQADAREWTDVDVSSRNTSGVITGLQPGTLYSVQLVASNAAGDSSIVTYGLPDDNRTLSTAEQDPMYQPSLTLKAATPESLTVSWSGPSAELAPYIQYYRLLRAGKDTATGSVVEVEVEYPSRLYVWRDLDAGRTYTMTVRACNRLVDLCGLWSDGINGTTLLDKSAQPQQVALHCQLYRQSPHLGTALVTWLPPDKTADLSQYTVSVTGKAEYYGKEGSLDHMFFGPDFKALPTDQMQAIFTVPPNTNYTAKVCADSSTGRCMGSSSATCSLGAGLPASEHLPDYSWWRVRQDEQWVLLLQVDRVAERNGAVCCYRVVVVRLGSDQQVSSLPSTDDITVSSYSQVQTEGSGAYLADMFEHDFVKTRYLTLGDGETLASAFSGSSSAPCATCRLAPPINSTTPSSTSSTPPARRRRAEHGHRRRRLVRESGGAGVLDAQDEQKRQELDIEDGPLDQHGRYTAFVQFLVRRADGVLSVASTGYLPPLSPAPSSIISDQAPTLAIVLGIICALSFCVLVLIVTLCALRHYGKEVSVSGAVRLMLESIRGHTLSGTPAPDLPPIGRGELVAAYQERHRDSDAGFRREFDCLPQCFHDRTTYASEALENSKKNRYPDIRAFDQTRVKLSQLNGVQSTEYINANYVWGYKERKKFICAQGPLDATIDDFWRMVWEQRCELMVMLTNLEEVGRNKCAKYWPEDGETTYGSINVSMSEEKSFSDYIRRVLHVSRPRPDGTVEIRRITHLHYLVWKDFMAPEHPTGLLRFIKRINQIYSLEMGPILVHCSAGVGRTGTLVAIDSLLQELDEEDEVTIFNTICDLRHQRNYLVQSLKQYVFVYRALMEMAQFGDTQIAADKLSCTYKTLIQPVRDRSRNKLDDEFRRLGDVLQERRSFVVGSAEENRQKNRYDYIVPYDANRVILAPVPNRPNDTYINASFIQGYDITETYVITQDPLKKTQADFWRMVVDLEVAVIIMLSELATPDTESSHKEASVIGGQKAAEAGDKISEASGKEASEADSEDATEAEDDKCPRYWPGLDEEILFDHFSVKTVGENTPVGHKLTIYSITVTNTRTKDSISTQLLQFCDWPTGKTALPDSVGPLTQLMSQCTSLQEQSSPAASSTPPVVVHCSGGGFRSSALVSLFILMRQMDRERCADVFQTVRKLRSQRQCMVQQLVQYDFLYRMLVEYSAVGTNSLGNGHTA